MKRYFFIRLAVRADTGSGATELPMCKVYCVIGDENEIDRFLGREIPRLFGGFYRINDRGSLLLNTWVFSGGYVLVTVDFKKEITKDTYTLLLSFLS